jgi:predicted RNA-binding protein with PIN domain
MSASGFVEEVMGVRQEIQEVAEQQRSKRTFAERLDSDTREALERMARASQ